MTDREYDFREESESFSKNNGISNIAGCPYTISKFFQCDEKFDEYECGPCLRSYQNHRGGC